MLSFLLGFWQDTDRDGAITFCLHGDEKQRIHIPLRELAAFGDEDSFRLLEYARESNLYFGLGLRVEGLGDHQSGKKQEILALPAFALDIDFYNPDAHKAKNLPHGWDEAAVLLEDAPDPTFVVETGNGAHVYWAFKDPMELESLSHRAVAQKAFKSFQASFIERAAEHGWHLDSTSGVQGIWRVPGSINQKTGRAVELVHFEPDTRYSFAELSASAPVSLVSLAPEEVRSGERVDLDLVRSAIKRVNPKNRFYEACRRLLAGESLAERGARDETLQGVAATVSWLEPCRSADPEELAELFRPSLEVWAAEEDAELSVEDEMAKVIDKIVRNQEDFHHQETLKKPKLLAFAAVIAKCLEGGAKDQVQETPLKYLIIQYRSIYFVWDFEHGEYGRAMQRTEVVPFVNRAWDCSTLDDIPEDVMTTYVNSRGEEKTKTVDRLLNDYGTVAQKAVGDMITRRGSYYDGYTFFEGLARHRVTEAVYDAELDEFLKVFAGAKYEQFLDWMAGVSQLGRQSAALCLIGPPSTGKTAFTNGVSRLYQEGGPTPLENAFDSFNAPTTRCPVLFGDENLPRRKGVSETLRRIIGSSTFMYNEKFEPMRTANGAVRVIIAANNDKILSTEEQLGVEDLEAYASRYLYVHTPRAAVVWLERHNVDNQLMTRWIEGDGIAKHCLYLAATRALNLSQRFIASGDETAVHRRLLMEHPLGNLVLEWLAKFAETPDRLYRFYDGRHEDSEDPNSPPEKPRALIGSDFLVVNARAVLDAWSSYMIGTARPSTKEIGSALSRLSDGLCRPGKREDQRLRFHRLRTNLIVEWSQLNQIVDVDRILENLSKPNPLLSNLKKSDDEDDDADETRAAMH